MVTAGSAPATTTSNGKVLVVGGTHGNERNAPWLLEAWAAEPGLLNAAGLAVVPVVGNPRALAEGRRYRDRDLNRSFDPALLADPARSEWEVERARALLATHGSSGEEPCLVAIDLHSTTAAMQGELGLPIYLHEGDPRQTGYLAEHWPCGLVIEVGPVPQGVLTALVTEQTRLALEVGLALLAKARRGRLPQPRRLVVHRHLASLDLPRRSDGSPAALIHPLRQHRDWQPLRPGDPLFVGPDGTTQAYRPPAGLEERPVWPVFINEAAYGEKGIALGLTAREVWPLDPQWAQALIALAAGLVAA